MTKTNILKKLLLTACTLLVFNVADAQKITYVGDTNSCDTMHLTLTDKYGTVRLNHVGCKILNITGLFKYVIKPSMVKIKIVSAKGHEVKQKYIEIVNMEVRILFPKMKDDYYSLYVIEGRITRDRVKLLFD